MEDFVSQHDIKYDIFLLEEKITHLRCIRQMTYESKIQITLKYVDSSIIQIPEDLFPFNLQGEISILLSDSIDYYQRQLLALQSMLK